MPSSFTWLDYSENERQKMLDLIEDFREKEARDELGLGRIRDAFADLFFPATSTIQTRARYFLFIPWMYLDLEGRAVNSSKIASRARQYEISLIESLLQSEDINGVIGKDARASLQRLPSSIYWQGLGILGIRRFPGSIDRYHKSLDSFYQRSRSEIRDDDGEYAAGEPLSNWHSGIPKAPDGFPDKASLLLTYNDADYLRDRICTQAPDSLFAFLARRGKLCEPVDFPWHHPQWGEFPQTIREQLQHAQNFSECIHGAPLLYNLMLAELVESEELKDWYRQWFEEWGTMIAERKHIYGRWDIGAFWNTVDHTGKVIDQSTKRFVEVWLGVIFKDGSTKRIISSGAARELVHQREVGLKNRLSRLENQKVRDLWEGEAGVGRLDYRWPIAQRHLLDIYMGLEGRRHHAATT